MKAENRVKTKMIQRTDMALARFVKVEKQVETDSVTWEKPELYETRESREAMRN